jgi:hypothetical protein
MPVLMRGARPAAVMKSWTSGPQCGDFVYICNEDAHNHCVRGESPTQSSKRVLGGIG